jgi:hypothetical protein
MSISLKFHNHVQGTLCWRLRARHRSNSAYVLDFADDQHAVANYPAEHHVLLVQPVRLGARDEELAAVGVLSAVGLHSRCTAVSRGRCQMAADNGCYCSSCWIPLASALPPRQQHSPWLRRCERGLLHRCNDTENCTGRWMAWRGQRPTEDSSPGPVCRAMKFSSA